MKEKEKKSNKIIQRLFILYSTSIFALELEQTKAKWILTELKIKDKEKLTEQTELGILGPAIE